jgi:hypothetical protein
MSGPCRRTSGQRPGGSNVHKLGVVVTVALLTALIAVPVSAAALKSPFIGSWSSIDPVDGSTQHLNIIGGTNVQMFYVDEFGTTCEEIGASTTVFSGVLTGRIAGNELNGWFKSAGCGSRLVLRAADFFVWTFEYDPNTDTLWGAINDGPATWYRD